MKVLLVAPQPFFAERGTPIAVMRLAETICADGHEVDLLTYPFGDDVELDGLTIHRCHRFPGVRGVRIGLSLGKLLTDAMLLPAMYSMAKPGRYDAVHAVEESIYFALLLRWRHRAKVIYDMDSSLAEQLVDSHTLLRPVAPLLRRIEQWAIRSAEVVAPMCRDLADYAAELRPEDDAVVLHDVPINVKDSTRRNGQTSPDSAARCQALYVGNLEAYQGIDMLIDAAAFLHPGCGVRIRVVGGPEAEAERLGRIAQRRGLEDRIQFVGPRPLVELHDVLAEADILLSPRSKGDNTPLKLYSYMESGRAILATRLRTHTQILDDSTALLVSPDAAAFARGLLLLATDEELRRELGESAKQRVRRSYSPASFTRRVREIYGHSRKRLDPSWDDRARNPSGAWNGVERRASHDRRSGGDRRTSARQVRERRIADRRVPAYA
jgi:glycosyltransferase involved in cell wall biosynthesis